MTRQVDRFLISWIGSAYRHINARSGRDILDFSFAGHFPDNRWNVVGQPTLYFAGDIGVAIAEWGRRFTPAFGADELKPSVRDVYQLQFRLDRLLDLRDPDITNRLDLSNAPDNFRNIEYARATANHIRNNSSAQAMLVPSIAFLDDLTRWNLVIFLNKMPTSTKSWITNVERIGPLAWTPN